MSPRWLKTREKQRKPLLPAILPPHLLSSIFSSILFSKQVKCLKRCIEVSACTLHDGYVVWHNAFERPSQIRWQMLFFCVVGLWPGWFWEFNFTFFLSASTRIFLLFSLCPFTRCDLLAVFFIEFHTRNCCEITSDKKCVNSDVSLSFISGGPPQHLLYFVLGLSCIYWHSFSISIVTDNNKNMPAGT